MACIAKRVIRSALIRVRSIVENVSREIVFPCGDHIEQKLLLHVNERGEMVRRNRNAASFQSVDFASDLLGGELVGIDAFFGERFVLVFGEEGGFVLKLQVHRVLDRGQLVVIETFLPSDVGTFVHCIAVLAIELGAGRAAVAGAQTLGTGFCVAFP